MAYARCDCGFEGNDSGLWTSITAGLDRYLQFIGKPQIYETQFRPDGKNGATQELYNRDLISDPLRLQLGGITIAMQQDQFGLWEITA
jgi:hypothetical protein